MIGLTRRLAALVTVLAGAALAVSCGGEEFTAGQGGSAATGQGGGGAGQGATGGQGAGGGQGGGAGGGAGGGTGGSLGECEAPADCADKPGTECVEGECVCPSSAPTYCEGAGCVDTDSDLAHCGDCTTVCVAGDSQTSASCSEGTCQYTCASSYDDCDADETTCETLLVSNGEHCGACGNECAYDCVGTICNDPVEVSAGDEFTCARTAMGQVYCWGWNQWGQIGGTITESIITPVPVTIPQNKAIASLRSRSRSSCALTTDGYLVAWGSSYAAATPNMSPYVLSLVDVDPESRDLNDRCWHVSGAGVAGFSPETAPIEPAVPVINSGSVTVAGGGRHACILSSLGTLQCQGLNDRGQLGRGTFNVDGTLQALGPVPGLSGVAQVAAGDAHTCARTTTNQLYCWGWDGYSQVGYGDPQPNASTPQLLPPSGNIEHIELGPRTSSAIIDGVLYLWGDNESKKVSTTSAATISTPTVYPTPAPVTDVALGLQHSCYISAGRIYCWGTGLATGHGALPQPTPTEVVLP